MDMIDRHLEQFSSAESLPQGNLAMWRQSWHLSTLGEGVMGISQVMVGTATLIGWWSRQSPQLCDPGCQYSLVTMALGIPRIMNGPFKNDHMACLEYTQMSKKTDLGLEIRGASQ